MFTLKLDNIPAEGLNLNWTEESLPYQPISKISPDRLRLRGTTPIRRAKVWKTGQSVLINGRVQTTLQLQCVRCLKEFSHPISSTFRTYASPFERNPLAKTELGEEDMESNSTREGKSTFRNRL
jgi:uncharacterized metal-binding protein YceD (DUF177 family)